VQHHLALRLRVQPGHDTVNQYFFLGFTDIHTLMAANGDGAKPIYMTEIGWSSTSAECETGAWAGQKLGGVSEATQATYLQEAYHCLAQPQYSYVKAAMWFEMANGAPANAPIDNYGLLDTKLLAETGVHAFEQESLHGDQLTGPCGDFNGPAITIAHPTPGTALQRHAARRGDGLKPCQRRALDPIRLSKNTLVQFVSKTFATDLSGSIAWQGGAKLKLGPHTITVTTDDKLGNISDGDRSTSCTRRRPPYAAPSTETPARASQRAQRRSDVRGTATRSLVSPVRSRGSALARQTRVTEWATGGRQWPELP
jgi:hypothetical protein